MDVAKSFHFLITEFGYQHTGSSSKDRINVLFYKNTFAKKQLEIAYSESYFHCEIRRLINGNPAPYIDKENCIGFEDLAILESDNNYDHFDYFAGAGIRLSGVVKNTIALFNRNKNILTTEGWFDVLKVRELKNKEFLEKFGIDLSKNRPYFIDQVKDVAEEILLPKGYKLSKYSRDSAPYDSDNMFQHIVFKKLFRTIKIGQQDWRDDYNLYYILKNGKKIFTIDISKVEEDKALQLIKDTLIIYR